MITYFEEQTHELSPAELQLVPAIVKGLKRRIGKNNAITSTEIVKAMNRNGAKLSGPRLRKIINHIRMTGEVELLMATSNGYYISDDADELAQYIESLRQRASAIDKVADQLQWQLDNAMVKVI